SLETGHVLDSSQQLIVRTIGACTFWRHRIDATDGVLQHTVHTTGVIGMSLPCSRVAYFRRIQQSRAMTGIAELGNHFFSAARGSASSSCACGGTRCGALFALDADF